MTSDIAYGAKTEDDEEDESKDPIYFNEMYLLAKGVKWFGTGDLMNEIIEIKKPSLQSEDYNLKKLVNSPQLLEKTILMSQFYRWNQISKYFLPSRTGEFLFVEYHNIIQNKEKS